MFAGYALLQLPEFLLMIYVKIKRVIQQRKHDPGRDILPHISANATRIDVEEANEPIPTMEATRDANSEENDSHIDMTEQLQQVSCVYSKIFIGCSGH